MPETILPAEELPADPAIIVPEAEVPQGSRQRRSPSDSRVESVPIGELPVPEDGAVTPPLRHRVSKPTAEKTSAKSPDPARERAKALRAERDAKIYQSPMANRRAQFESWKNRNLPWKRDSAPADADR